MTREHRAISAMGPTAVPVPETLGLCTDDGVNGAPFYVMSLVEGVVSTPSEMAEQVGPADRRRCPSGLADVLAELHGLDVDAVGLGDFARRDGYVERQIARWSKQWDGSKTRELPASTPSPTQLVARIPEQQGVAVVHGDYRFGNCITDVATGQIMAVLDWELCTLGDPSPTSATSAVVVAAGDGDGRHNDPTGCRGVRYVRRLRRALRHGRAA